MGSVPGFSLVSLAKMIKFFLARLSLFFLYRFLRGYLWTLRLTVENEDPWRDHLDSGGRVLLCSWHQQFLLLIRHFKRYAPYHPALMISKSRDGDIISGVAKRTGWVPVRGSSSKDGNKALKEMILRLQETGLAGHIVDGPRGPAGQVKAGLIRLARAADAVIVPICIDIDRVWHLNSWDRFMVPKPFARVILRFDDMIRLEGEETRESFERHRQYVENKMLPWLVW